MLTDLSSFRVLLYMKSVDMRKSIDGLSIMVSGVLSEDPCSGDIFIFCNRNKDKIKILYWHINGYCLFYKRLEHERFKLQYSDGINVVISIKQLRWLLDGLDINKVRGHKSRSYKVHV